MKKLKVLVKNVAEQPKKIEIDATGENYSDIVNGYFEVTSLGSGFAMVCNEDGRLIDLPTNFYIQGTPIVGNVFFTKVGSNGSFVSLTDSDITLLKSRLEFNEETENKLKRGFEKLLLDLDFTKYVATVKITIADIRELHMFDTDDFLDVVFHLPVETQKRLFIELVNRETRAGVIEVVEDVIKMYICGQMQLPPEFAEMIEIESAFVE